MLPERAVFQGLPVRAWLALMLLCDHFLLPGLHPSWRQRPCPTQTPLFGAILLQHT